MCCVQGQGRGFGGQGHPPTPAPPGMTKDQRRNAKAMAKLDKQVEAEKPRVYKPLSEEERLEAARWATISSLLGLPWSLIDMTSAYCLCQVYAFSNNLHVYVICTYVCMTPQSGTVTQVTG